MDFESKEKIANETGVTMEIGHKLGNCGTEASSLDLIKHWC